MDIWMCLNLLQYILKFCFNFEHILIISVVWYLIIRDVKNNLFNITDCLFHGAVDVVSNTCYGKQRCLFTVDEEHFKNPCPPGTKKYITVLYACGMNALISIKISLKAKSVWMCFLTVLNFLNTVAVWRAIIKAWQIFNEFERS